MEWKKGIAVKISGFKITLMLVTLKYNKLTIYTDGGARGNPGPAGVACVIYDEKGKLIGQYSKFIGTTTNNQAEYQALIFGLEKAKEISAKKVKCFLDSELISKQLTGQYRIKDKDLKPLFAKILRLTNRFDSVTFRYIPREKNKLADKLVNLAINKGNLIA